MSVDGRQRFENTTPGGKGRNQLIYFVNVNSDYLDLAKGRSLMVVQY